MGSPARWSVVVLALLVAGCADSAQPGAAETSVMEQPLDVAVVPEGPVADVAVGVPAWNVGDAWAYRSVDGDTEEQGFLVVTAADGASYTVETTIENAAALDAMLDLSYVGKIRASDLAGHQDGQPVQYFSFPLTDGKSWTTMWDGREVTLTATKSARGFSIVGAVGDETYVTYDYVPDLKWLSQIHFTQGDYGFRIERLETNWTGTVATAVAKQLYEGAPIAPVGGANTGAFTIDEGQTFALVTVVGGGAHWARVFYLIDPSGAPHHTTDIPNADAEAAGRREYLQERIPATAGQWHIVSPTVHDPNGGFLVMVHQVATSARAFP